MGGTGSLWKLVCALLIAATAIGLVACGGEDSSIDIENASRHEAASATTPYRLACTDPDEPTNFAYFTLGKKYGSEAVSGVARRCIASATKHRTEPNEVTYFYGTCEPQGSDDSGCSDPYTITSSPACQLNYSDYHPPRGVRHAHTKLKTWPNGAVSVTYFDLMEVHVYTGTSTIQLSRGQGSTPEQLTEALNSIRVEPSGKPLGEPASKAAGPVGIDSLPAPAPGAMQDKLRCNA